MGALRAFFVLELLQELRIHPDFSHLTRFQLNSSQIERLQKFKKASKFAASSIGCSGSSSSKIHRTIPAFVNYDVIATLRPGNRVGPSWDVI